MHKRNYCSESLVKILYLCLHPLWFCCWFWACLDLLCLVWTESKLCKIFLWIISFAIRWHWIFFIFAFGNILCGNSLGRIHPKQQLYRWEVFETIRNMSLSSLIFYGLVSRIHVLTNFCPSLMKFTNLLTMVLRFKVYF